MFIEVVGQGAKFSGEVLVGFNHDVDPAGEGAWFKYSMGLSSSGINGIHVQ